MVMSYSRILLAGAAMLALGACNTANRNIGSEDVAMGEAVKYNDALQTINPAPVYTSASAQPGGSGSKGAAAVKRYRTDTVKQVETMQTTGSTSSGSMPH
jgi:hypothetical protein